MIELLQEQENLFQNIKTADYRRLLHCLGAQEKQFRTGETIYEFGLAFRELGILESGTASIVRYEFNGARTILERLEPQSIFGQMLSHDTEEEYDIHVVCDTPCQVLFLQYARISAPCSKACSCHQQLIRNLLDLIASRAISLSRRVEVLSQRTIREKLLCYFYQLAGQAHSGSFRLPFTMVDLADYLSIDRSAMTRELRRMREDGIVEVEKRTVRFL